MVVFRDLLHSPFSEGYSRSWDFSILSRFIEKNEKIVVVPPWHAVENYFRYGFYIISDEEEGFYVLLDFLKQRGIEANISIDQAFYDDQKTWNLSFWVK